MLASTSCCTFSHTFCGSLSGMAKFKVLKAENMNPKIQLRWQSVRFEYLLRVEDPPEVDGTGCEAADWLVVEAEAEGDGGSSELTVELDILYNNSVKCMCIVIIFTAKFGG